MAEPREAVSIIVQAEELAALAPGLSRLSDGRLVAKDDRCAVVADPTDPRAVPALIQEVLRLRAQLAQANELAILDPLTGLRNRRFLDRTLPYELDRRRRYERPFTLMLLDLDHFKRVNDTRGHDVGDAVLRAVADTLRGVLRRADMAVRHGGEEFAVMLPETPPEGAFYVAERLRRAISALDVDGIRLTASIGVASVEGRWEGDPEALVRAADQALYQAKRGGRDRIVVSNLVEGSIDSSPGPLGIRTYSRGPR